MYLLLKHLHLIAVTLSLSLFFMRSVWMLMGSQLYQLNWLRKASQGIDSILLACAIALTLIIQQYPLTHDWLTAKVAALIIYILAGTIALNRGKSHKTRTTALTFAALSVIYIIWVARTHSPIPWTIG
ncbi:SirB2 family protein [Motiliproteus sp. MSK22-1]|uniref:SirB2 family protein n=1 Tax=Motiliproteus sp. MSK22-1 TaxID=1897630 RepID=UPI00097839C8|nr:SirB2 family protein [Motiliproteus sp. MSK22-1]OMH28421.1 hypothetical protein BGP75_21220 [Motiliproteus sp. MSK22-1]